MYIEQFKDIEVSYYNTVKTSTGGTTSLAEFLAKDFSRDVLEMRFATSDAKRRKAKLSLPAITVSGVFHPERRLENFVGHSGLICIDIDAKDNPTRNFVGEFPSELTEWDIISYLSRSASGKGLFALVRLQWPLCHKNHFRALAEEFRKRDLVVDSACSDLTRLRCATYDPWPFFNPNAVAFTGLCEEEEPSPVPVFNHSEHGPGAIARLVDRAVREGRIVLDDYAQWLRVAYALTSLGEDGRELFHRLSATSSKYKRWETDRLFSSALRTSRGEVSLGTLFRLLGE